MSMRWLRIVLALAAMSSVAGRAAAASPPITLAPVVTTGLAAPVFVAPAGDTRRARASSPPCWRRWPERRWRASPRA